MDVYDTQTLNLTSVEDWFGWVSITSRLSKYL
jgi:hypothetical protein